MLDHRFPNPILYSEHVPERELLRARTHTHTHPLAPTRPHARTHARTPACPEPTITPTEVGPLRVHIIRRARLSHEKGLARGGQRAPAREALCVPVPSDRTTANFIAVFGAGLRCKGDPRPTRGVDSSTFSQPSIHRWPLRHPGT